MTPEVLLQYAIQAATAIVAGAGAWAGVKHSISDVKRDAAEADRKGNAAHKRLDKIVDAENEDKVARAALFAEIRAALANLTIEVDRLRKASHDGRAEMSGHMARIENDIDELKERIPRG